MCWDRVIEAEAKKPEQAKAPQPSEQQDERPVRPAVRPEPEKAPALAEAAR
jgi:hypothetical protein